MEIILNNVMIQPNRPNLPLQLHQILAQHYLFWPIITRRKLMCLIPLVYMVMSILSSLLKAMIIICQHQLLMKLIYQQQHQEITKVSIDNKLYFNRFDLF